jgi:predicted AlkP superfamily pyrophosphatase or phosphodiesterase
MPNRKCKEFRAGFFLHCFYVTLIAILGSTGHAGAQMARHVVLISIDGMRPEFYLDSTWNAPNLRQIMRRGSYARHMKSVFPSFTYPSHSSMVTGAYPAVHKVCYNAPFAPTGGDGSWNWATSNIKARTIWDASKEAGLTTAIVEWPVSVGAPVTYNIPEIWPVKDGDDRITASRKYATPGLVEEIEENATGKLTRGSMNESYLSFDENAGRMAAYIIGKYKPNILALHFACVDGEEHEYGRDGDSVRLAVAANDRAIGDVLEAIDRAGIKDSTTVIIVGDHGFSNFYQVIQPNVWLLQNGLLHPGQDWGAMFQPAGGSAFLYLQHPEDTTVLSEIRQAINQAPDSLRSRFRIVEKPELVRMGADSKALMALAAYPGTIFGGGSRGPQSFYHFGGHHGYDPNQPEMYTGFIAAGPGIRLGGVIPELTVVDIAPIVMALLGVEFQCPSGKIPPGLFNK